MNVSVQSNIIKKMFGVNDMQIDIQLFADVEKGNFSNNRLSDNDNNTQFYGLAGNDTIESGGRNAILIGGSGNDILHMLRGKGTLNGGAGNDTFGFDYSTGSTIDALIEDIDPVKDRILINYRNSAAASGWNYQFNGLDLILSDTDHRLNITLKGTMPLDEYYDQDGNEQIWEVLEEVNEEREDAGLAPLTLSQEIMDATAVRANELVEYYSHTRPDGTSCFTALKNNVGYRGENIAVGYRTADDIMDSWMNSAGHRANILNANFDKLGVGYTYDSNSEWKTHWVQMFRSHEYSDDTLSHDELLNTTVVLSSNNGSNQTMTLSQLIALDSVEHVDTINTSEFYNRNKNSLVSGTSGNDTIYNDAGGVTIFGGAGNDFIYNFTLSNYTVNGDYGYVTIDGGAGNDSIESHDPYVSINGGEDND